MSNENKPIEEKIYNLCAGWAEERDKELLEYLSNEDYRSESKKLFKECEEKNKSIENKIIEAEREFLRIKDKLRKEQDTNEREHKIKTKELLKKYI